jgi:hypothetical protein
MFAGGCGLVCRAFRAIDVLQGLCRTGTGLEMQVPRSSRSDSWRRDLALVCVTMDLNVGIKF